MGENAGSGALMKFHIRNGDGELVVPSYAELRTLYLRKFIADDDEIRREGSDQWIRAGQMPDLRTAKPRPFFHGFEFVWLSIAIAVGSLILILLRR
jgi:hypothetical protein